MDEHLLNLFGGTLSTLSRSLDLRARNHEMVLNNIANADTPNFKPFAVRVEEALQKDPPAGSATHLNRTDEKHLAGHPTPDGLQGVAASARDENPLLLRGDQNGVDIDAEMAAQARNSLLYKVSAQIVSSKFKGLKNVINGGPK